MIDLHTHTTYSDGTDSVLDILKCSNNINLEVLSITDHNKILAYKELEKLDVSKHYNGKIIVGCEFTTSYNGLLIEVLGYGFDYNKIEKFLDQYYNPELGKERAIILCNRLLDKIKKIGLIFNIEDVRKKKTDNEFFEKCIYDELIKHNENQKILDENVFSSFSDFYRKGLTNPKSKLFINKAEFLPKLEDIINIIHNSGGVVFLAHPYQYKFNNTEEFLENIYNDNNFDGIECFYTTFSKNQTDYLLGFAKTKKLLISGGSDYHGTNKKNHKLAYGNNNLNIDKNILKDWNIDYFN